MDIYEKSFDVLKRIVKGQIKHGYSIYLIGGWAVWVYNPYMKSKDIDFIVQKPESWKLANFLLSLGFKETAKVLQKRGFAMLWDTDKIEIDVYDERIEKIRIGELIPGAVTKRLNGLQVRVVSPTNLFILKAVTALERLGTAKGEKDISDLLALLDKRAEEVDFNKVNQKVNLKDVLKILLPDYRLVAKRYPMEMARYRQLRANLKELHFL